MGEQTVSAQCRVHTVPTFGLQLGRGMAQSMEREQRMRDDWSTYGVRHMLIRFLSQGSGESRSC